MITVKNLHKSFHGTDVLKGINETIHKGEKVVVIGPSGSGKSTFLRCLNLLETPTEGEVWVEGNNITAPKTDIDKVRQKMGMVFQHFNLFPHLTVKKNITLAPTTLKLQTEEEAGENAMRLLKRIGLEEKADSYPNQLSGGQKQRIAIIRALAMNPDVMLFDEPTSALDPEMVGEVLELSLIHIWETSQLFFFLFRLFVLLEEKNLLWLFLEHGHDRLHRDIPSGHDFALRLYLQGVLQAFFTFVITEQIIAVAPNGVIAYAGFL